MTEPSPFGAPVVRRGRPVHGRFRPPGDKSITHRAILFGLLAEGRTTTEHANPGEDCESSASCAVALGAQVHGEGAHVAIAGRAGRLTAAAGAQLDCGNSGTTLRLLAGVLAGQPLDVTLSGDASLNRRPVARVIEPLTRMGAVFEAAGGGRTPPLRVRGGRLHGIDYDVPVASAQVATAVLLAGLAAEGTTRVSLPGPARDHTERMLPAFGVPLHVEPLAGGGRRVTLEKAATLRATEVRVPGDFSSAAFLLAAAAATPGARVTAADVNLNPTRTGFLDVLREMGAVVTVERERVDAGEPVGDVTVGGPEALRAFDVPPEWVPRLVDEAPAWVVVASAARGTSRLTGAAELRVKESDRIAALAAGLARVGVRARELPDGLEVEGGPVGGGRIEAHLDHRIVMAFGALGARSDAGITFDDASSALTSFPDYFRVLIGLGADVIPGALDPERPR